MFQEEYTSLESAFYDAIDIYDLISENWHCDGDHKILLTGNDSTTKNVNTAFNELLMRHASSGDRIFIYLSGHIEPDVRGITGSFVTTDFSKKSHNYGLNLRSLRYLVEDSLASYVIVIIDGCYSGVVAQGDETLTPQGFYFTKGIMDSELSTKLFITAASSGELAFEHEDKRNSDVTELVLSIMSRSLELKENLSTSLFYEILAREASQAKISRPIKSGVEVGYSQLIFAKDDAFQRINIRKDFDSPFVHIPKWLKEVLNTSQTSCEDDKCLFIKNNSFPDGSILKIGEKIIKSWRVRNAGKVPWENRFLKLVNESRGAGCILSSKLIPIPTVKPGEDVDLNVELIMPPYPGSVYSEFKMVDAAGNICIPHTRGLYIQFDVIDTDE